MLKCCLAAILGMPMIFLLLLLYNIVLNTDHKCLRLCLLLKARITFEKLCACNFRRGMIFCTTYLNNFKAHLERFFGCNFRRTVIFRCQSALSPTFYQHNLGMALSFKLKIDLCNLRHKLHEGCLAAILSARRHLSALVLVKSSTIF